MDYAHAFVAEWKDGPYHEEVEPGLVIVSLDQSNHVYKIDSADFEGFYDWVGDTWMNCRDIQRQENESIEDFFDRAGIHITVTHGRA